MSTLEKLTEHNPILKRGLRIELINKALIKNKGNAKSVLYDTLEIGEILKKSIDYFKSPECRQILKEENLILTIEDFLLFEFGLKKSWAYKLIKGSKDKRQLNKFCETNPNTYGLEPFLKWLNHSEDKKVPVKIILSVKFNDIKATIDENGKLETNNSKSELRTLIIRLTAELDKMS